MRPGNPRPSSPDYDPVVGYNRDRYGEVDSRLIRPSSPYYDPILSYEVEREERNSEGFGDRYSQEDPCG